MNPFTSVEDAVSFVNSIGDAENLELPIADALQDPVGLNMAILLDAILAKGLFPDGFEQHEGYRLYRYGHE